MSLPRAIVSITSPMNTSVTIGTPTTVGAVVIANESPYAIQALAGGSGKWISPQTADLLLTNSMAFDGSITLITSDILDNSAQAPSYVGLLTTYVPGEQVPGTYPVALARLTNGGNVGTPSNSIEQDMWTPFVLGDTITPSHTGNTYQTSTGVAFLRQSDNSLLRISVNATSQNLTGISTTYYHDLNPDGSFSLGTSHSTQPNYLTIATITTNSSGNITTLTDTRVRSTTLWNGMQNAAGAQGVSVYNLHVFKDIQADDQISVQGKFHVSSPNTGQGYNIGSDTNADLVFTPDNNSSQSSIYFSVNPTGTPPLSVANVLSLGAYPLLGSVQIDTGGVVHANAPITLVSGYQETGNCGYRLNAPSAGYTPDFAVNFKTMLTNTPTSITLNANISQINQNSVGAIFLSKQGFLLQWNATAAGDTAWLGQYTTVGNCLLAVNTAAGTLDHHCDTCGHVSTAAPLSAVYHASGLQPVMSYACPACGATEAFNTMLTAADEADTAPQGTGQYATTRGAQASLIRSLMTALGLEVQP